jgi:Meckel syndrome type 1 protein
MHALPAAAALPALSPPSPQLARCLLLALLLHVWLVLLLGNAPGGTARPGEGVGGAINITLRGPETPGAAEPTPPAPPATPTGPSGSGTLPRWGGAVREPSPAPQQPQPGAAQLGDWAAKPSPAAEPAPPLPPPGRVVEERSLPAPPPPPPPLPVAAEPSPTPPAERSFDSSLTRAGPATPELKALESPAPVATPPLSAPQPLPELAAPVTTPVSPASPAVEEVPLRRLAAPVPAPSATAAPLPRTPSLATTPLPSLQPLPALGAGLPATMPSPSPGAPDAGSRVGVDVAVPPAAAASVPPRLNLELARPRGGELSRHGTPGVLPLLPRPPELADKLARDIEKAAKADCRKAHSGLGLLAVVPLAVDAARKDGCKW